MTGAIIRKKQFWGEKTLKTYIVEDGTTEIGDWAFAGCAELARISVPLSVERIGREAFSGCEKLKEVELRGDCFDEKKSRACAEMMAFAVRWFPEAAELIVARRAGMESWLEAWDQAGLKFLERPCEEGFRPFLAGGEEDYEDDEKALKNHCHERLLTKANLILTRLMAAEQGIFLVSEKKRAELHALLRGNDAAWEVLYEPLSEPRLVVRIFEDAGLLTAALLKNVIPQIPAENVELRALLMQKVSGDAEVGINELWL